MSDDPFLDAIVAACSRALLDPAVRVDRMEFVVRTVAVSDELALPASID